MFPDLEFKGDEGQCTAWLCLLACFPPGCHKLLVGQAWAGCQVV